MELLSLINEPCDIANRCIETDFWTSIKHDPFFWILFALASIPLTNEVINRIKSQEQQDGDMYPKIITGIVNKTIEQMRALQQSVLDYSESLSKLNQPTDVIKSEIATPPIITHQQPDLLSSAKDSYQRLISDPKIIEKMFLSCELSIAELLKNPKLSPEIRKLLVDCDKHTNISNLFKMINYANEYLYGLAKLEK